MPTRNETAKILGWLAALFPHFKLTEYTIEAYHTILEDVPVDLLMAAARHLGSQNTKWFPAAGQLRTAAFDLIDHTAGVPSAYDAWAEVTQAFGTHGRDRQPKWSHELIGMAVKAIGGWRMLCDSPIEMVAADRARFVQAYQTFLSRAQTETRMLPGVRRVIEGLAPCSVGLAAGQAVDEIEGGEG